MARITVEPFLNAFRSIQQAVYAVTVVPGRDAAIASFLTTSSVRKLHLGCGDKVLDGWLNTDYEHRKGVVWMDLRQRLPFADASIDYIYGEHVVEHIEYYQAEMLLAECRRILKPAGKIRLATPDLEFLLGLYGTTDAFKQRYIREMCERWQPEKPRPSAVFVINNAFYNWGHRFVYDYDTLSELLSQSGFVQVCRREIGESRDPHLQGLETNDERLSLADNRPETMVIEAESPSG